MAEVEIHTAHGAHADGFGQAVGILVGIIGILLAIVTILSHREHTAAVVHKTEANDQWAYYQAKKIREHTAQVGAGLLTALASDPAKVAAISGKFTQDSERYAREADAISAVARERDGQSRHAEDRAIRFDLGEGFLELGLVMSSLYFLSRKRFFVALGSVAAAIGAAIGVIGLLA
ncbi:MAG TPA: DUF4337 domain-containing protein [Steroidobacteraceae bacterium]|jgi:hypothetical protein|nr:DUF4337 domain-containing protein [Steroidobacteraceae bacterium]